MSILIIILAVIGGFWAFGFLLNALAVLLEHYDDGFLGLLWDVVQLLFWATFWVIAGTTVLLHFVPQF